MNIEFYILMAEEEMEKTIESYQNTLNKISTGRANPLIFSKIQINYYNTPTLLNQIASITVPQANQLLVKPYDTSTNAAIVKVITSLNIDVQINDEGNQVRIIFPIITTERRRQLVRNMAKYTEQAKVGIRLARQNVNRLIKKNDEISEDVQKNFLNQIQESTNKFILKVNQLTKTKEIDLMRI